MSASCSHLHPSAESVDAPFPGVHFRNVLTWHCIDCERPTELNRHGYCARCGSNSVIELATTESTE